MNVRVLVLSFLLFPGLALAAPMTCRRSPALTGKCGMVKGSLGLTPQVGVTLDKEDGGRILIVAPPGSDADIAPDVMQNWLYWETKSGSMNTRISGTYEVCPLPAQENRAGITQSACISNGRSITEDKAAR
ncbi:MAG TPA: hypothetical protein VHV26_12510 [Rhizomicrobium sp.]|jgi:hypothetical protein|nr:hypothetical protein [Rhizomicrobium sp.]